MDLPDIFVVDFKRRKLLFLSILLGFIISVSFSNCGQAYSTDQFVLHLDGPPEVAKEIAAKHDFIYLDKIFDNYYHLKHRRKFKRSAASPGGHNISSDIFKEPLVNSLTQLHAKRRVKRDLLRSSFSTSFLRSPDVEPFNDPKWPQMWYLNRGHNLDMNVQKAWAMNITGRGVVISILDDGLEGDHPDLIDNYDPKASYDVNNSDEDPTPRYDIIDSNRHGTRCAGEVAAMANNGQCSVGVAYHSKVGGVRMLDGDVTDAVEARSIGFNSDHIHIYSASWGPDDDGKTVDGPGELATRAFIDGVSKGRNGLGSIFIWASGNGGREHDNCNCDGYTNSIWTLSVSSATENGQVPWYSEACSSTLATTYSSGSFGEKQIVTTDLHHSCTITHTGTSASAPLAAAIAALALEANPKLTWRDMQHIVVMTSRPANLKALDWKTNGVGRKVSHSFGYGLMDATAMVKTAQVWVTVPEQKICEVRSTLMDKLIPSKSHIEMSLNVNCDHVHFMEHVQAKVNLSSTRRGDIHIYLTSPSGTRSTLLAQRPMDNSHAGFQDWPFMTVHSWGENPNGIWKLEVHNEGKYYNRAFLKGWTMVMLGTTINPDRRLSRSEKPHSTAYRENKIGEAVSNITVFSEAGSSVSNLDGTAIINSTSKQINPPLSTNDVDASASIDHSATNIREDSHTSKGIFFHRTRENNPKSQFGFQSTDVNAGCSLKDSNSRCLECSPGLALFDGGCVYDCPNRFYKEQVSIAGRSSSETSFVCVDCHYTCKSCSGPNDNNCTSCHDDAQLNRNGHCDSKDLIIQILSMERYYTAVTVVFLCLCLFTSVLLIYTITEKNPQLLNCCTQSRSQPNSYNGFTLQDDRRSNFLRLKSIRRLKNFYSHLSEEEM